MMFGKRDATPEEAKKGLETHANYFNRCNPGFEISMQDLVQKEKEAVLEGYKAEVCSCGNIFCAFHHWTTCSQKYCPFSNGKSMLDYLDEN